MKDLELLSASFLDYELPEGKEYIYKYFKSNIKRIITNYYFYFDKYLNESYTKFYKEFINYTGISCGQRHFYYTVSEIIRLETTLKKARENKDHELVATILSGNYKEYTAHSKRKKKKSSMLS